MNPKEIGAMVRRETAGWAHWRMLQNALEVQLADAMRQRNALNVKIAQLRARLDKTSM